MRYEAEHAFASVTTYCRSRPGCLAADLAQRGAHQKPRGNRHHASGGPYQRAGLTGRAGSHSSGGEHRGTGCHCRGGHPTARCQARVQGLSGPVSLPGHHYGVHQRGVGPRHSAGRPHHPGRGHRFGGLRYHLQGFCGRCSLYRGRGQHLPPGSETPSGYRGGFTQRHSAGTAGTVYRGHLCGHPGPCGKAWFPCGARVHWTRHRTVDA